jgi:DNA-binding HxlR family transcriptional regulator
MRTIGLAQPVQELNPPSTENVLARLTVDPYPSSDGLTRMEGAMPDSGYNQFCPVAMAAEILGARWTLLLLRELLVGSTRFNDLRRGVPRMSPALLSKRLKDLETAGIVTRCEVSGEPGVFEYQLTAAGRDLQNVVEAVGNWGQRWVETETTLENLDPELLMWDIRRNIDPKPMPRRRTTIQIIFKDLAKARQSWWLIVQPGQDVDLCSVDPGFDVDLYLSTDLRTMTEIWMGYATIARAKERGKLFVSGNRQLETTMRSWFSLSPFAKVDKLVA